VCHIVQFTVKVNPEVNNQWVHVEIEVKSTTENGVYSISLKLQNDNEEVKGNLKIER
jgi:hypothetical protein